MKWLHEFREFAIKGNVIDLAVGVVIGTAFNKIVTSLVNDIIMPPLAVIMGKVNFADFYANLSGGEYETLKAAKEAGAVTLNYGNFFNIIIEFLLVALAVFLLVKQINFLRRMAERDKKAAEPTTKDCPFCLSKIPLRATRCAHCTSELKPA